MSTATRLLRRVGCWLALSVWGCGSTEPDTGRLGATQLPSREQFPLVGEVMQRRCGTLDCHGQVGRNLRLHGFGGLRLSTPQNPIRDPLADPTTAAEVDASYASTIGLEPEALWQVVAQRTDVNLLSVVRKTRGIEAHKGGQLARPGDALDRCLVLFLTNRFDPVPCEQVRDAPRPEVD
jgi:hypothetical protein